MVVDVRGVAGSPGTTATTDCQVLPFPVPSNCSVPTQVPVMVIVAAPRPDIVTVMAPSVAVMSPLALVSTIAD